MARGTATIAGTRHRSALNADPGPRMVAAPSRARSVCRGVWPRRIGVPAPNLRLAACDAGWPRVTWPRLRVAACPGPDPRSTRVLTSSSASSIDPPYAIMRRWLTRNLTHSTTLTLPPGPSSRRVCFVAAQPMRSTGITSPRRSRGWPRSRNGKSAPGSGSFASIC